jgi:hypothetical protein
MEKIVGPAAVPVSLESRVVRAEQLAAILHGLRMTRALINKIELIVEDIYLNGMSVPNKKEIIVDDN